MDLKRRDSPSLEGATSFFGCRPGALQHARAVLAQHCSDEAIAALAELKRRADRVLRDNDILSVVHKTQLPPSGDKHDYASYAPYWWPDPDSASGLPYVRRDGVMNPDAKDDTISDSSRRIKLELTMRTACMAYYFTGEEKYAAYALRQARCWFLDEETRMNPHLTYAQARRGSIESGNRCGLLEGRHIIQAADALGMIAEAEGWRADEREQLDEWLRRFLDWYIHSHQGEAESRAENNHGSFYDEQVARLALCLGRGDLAQQVLQQATQKRIAAQVDADGRMPAELARTNSLSYSMLNLRALCALAVLGEHVGVDLWSYRSEGGGCIAAAFDFVSPYIDPQANAAAMWPYEQQQPFAFDAAGLAALPELRMAALVLCRPEYEDLAGRLRGSSGSSKFDAFLATCGKSGIDTDFQ